jgi:hypothetical protein
MKGTPASPATALARRVLPVPKEGAKGGKIGEDGFDCVRPTPLQWNSRTWWTVEDDTSGNLTTHVGVGFRLLQKVNDFRQFQLGSVASSDIVKGNASVRDHLNFSLGLSKAHGISWTTHADTAASSAQKEETCKKSSWEDQALGEFSKSAGLLSWKDRHVDL